MQTKTKEERILAYYEAGMNIDAATEKVEREDRNARSKANLRAFLEQDQKRRTR